MQNSHIIHGNAAVDDRGIVKFVNDFDFKNVKRFYQIQNHKRGYIRAWHGHRNEGKYVYVTQGTFKIGVILLKPESTPTIHILSDTKPSILWIPPNHANGFMNLTENGIIQFFSTSTLEDSLEDDIRFDYNMWNIWEENYR